MTYSWRRAGDIGPTDLLMAGQSPGDAKVTVSSSTPNSKSSTRSIMHSVNGADTWRDETGKCWYLFLLLLMQTMFFWQQNTMRPLLRNLLFRSSFCWCARRLAHTSRVQVLSGIQPTGSIHLGNYFGAIKQWTEYQNGPHEDLLPPANAPAPSNIQYLPPVIQIVDMHSITTSHDSELLHNNIFDIAAVLLACGIDPKKCILFKQSSVPLTAYLCWVLCSISTMPQLSRFPQFKVCVFSTLLEINVPNAF